MDARTDTPIRLIEYTILNKRKDNIMKKTALILAGMAIVLLSGCVAQPVLTPPPSFASSYMYPQAGQYRSYQQSQYQYQPYMNTQPQYQAQAQRGGVNVVGGLLGAGVGGILGAQIGRGNGRVAATGVGAALGALVGAGM
jgi:outer membrane lipoprotein SlyB